MAPKKLVTSVTEVKVVLIAADARLTLGLLLFLLLSRLRSNQLAAPPISRHTVVQVDYGTTDCY